MGRITYPIGQSVEHDWCWQMFRRCLILFTFSQSRVSLLLLKLTFHKVFSWHCIQVDVKHMIFCYYPTHSNYRICACISRTFDNNLPSKKLGAAYTRNIVLLTTEPATSVLYVVKIPVETVSVWDCYLESYCTRANAPTYYRCIGIFWLHESSRHHRFPEVRRLWHHWQITVNAASDNQSAANAIANILLSHR
jgi:hypothetical protein